MTKKSQKPVKGGRIGIHAAVVRELRRIVEKEARRYNCSKSWVVTYHLASSLKIDCEPYWYD